jgi:aspartate aminotransferase-like enzyme
VNTKIESIAAYVESRNSEKILFTAGPAALLAENLNGLRPCFGRGDDDYAAVEAGVMGALQKMSGHANVVRMQGAASLALEVMALNYLYGRVLVVQSGYYSQRLTWLANSALRRVNQVKEVHVVEWAQLEQIEGKFDWVFACYTETSNGLKLPIELLRTTADKLSSKLMLDATASIGLETRHELADVIAYSSCKGLFGLAGAAFIAYHDAPSVVEVDSFYLNMRNHIEKMMTGPYHAIASLSNVLAEHEAFRESVQENKRVFTKRMAHYLTRPSEQQPLLCTHVRCKLASKDKRVILYAPRSDFGGSVVCHLGEVHLGRAARGEILSTLEIEI